MIIHSAIGPNPALLQDDVLEVRLGGNKRTKRVISSAFIEAHSEARCMLKEKEGPEITYDKHNGTNIWQ